MPDQPSRAGDLVGPTLRRASDIAGRLLLVGAAGLAVLWVLDRLQIVVFTLYFALLIAAAVVPVVARLERRGWPTLAATWVGFGGLLATVAGVVALISPVIVHEFEDFPTVIEEGVDDVEDWLVTGPLELERAKVDDFRNTFGDRVSDFVASSSDGILAGAVAVFEGVATAFLSIVLAFFLIKDGRRFQAWALAHLPRRHEASARSMGAAAWSALGAYLRASALLGIVEALVLGGTLWAVGSGLVLPVMLLTFAGAFVPLVGAVVSGVLAVLVALVSGGAEAAATVAIVAVLVQQFDNDLLAPLIYGRAVSLHPAAVLLSIAVGGSLAGLPGTFLAVPVAAVIGAVGSDLWSRHGEGWRERT